MNTTVLAMVILGGMAMAQTPSMTPDSQQVGSDQATAPSQATVKPQTVRGCLNSVGDNYTVTDQVSGKTFKLEGSTDRLKQYIGQTVEITGSVKSLDGDSKPASASTGDNLTLTDVKQVSDKCSTVPQSGALAHRVELLARMQRPVSDDANTQLESSAQMSSNAQDTSAAAANTRSVTSAEASAVPQHAVAPMSKEAAASEEEGNRAAVAATRAEMETEANGQKTTYSTMPKTSEANATQDTTSPATKKKTVPQPK